jgi:hypothetical protein
VACLIGNVEWTLLEVHRADMPGCVRWQRIITLANLVVAVLVVLGLFEALLALSVLAPEISSWQLLTLLAIGIPISAVGLWLTKNLGSRVWRRLGLLINGAAIALYATIILGIGVLLIRTTNRRFIIPEGYKGDVYILYGDPNGKPAIRHATITFSIPTDGVLYTTAPVVGGWTRDEYYFEDRNGAQRRIGNLWSTTVQQTPENLANNKDIGIFFPRSGTIADSTGCTAKFEQFYVGTKAYLLSGYAAKDTNQILKEVCSGLVR